MVNQSDDELSSCTLLVQQLKTAMQNGNLELCNELLLKLNGCLYPTLVKGARKYWSLALREAPGGYNPENEPSEICWLVNMAMSHIQNKLLIGKDHFDFNKGSFEGWAYHTAEHFWLDLARRRKQRDQWEVQFPENAHETEVGSDFDEVFPHAKPANPERELLRKDHIEEWRQKLEPLINKKPLLGDVIGAINDGCKPKPQDLANYLSVDVNEIYNLFRYVRRNGSELI